MDDLISRQAALRTDCFGDGHEGLRAFHVYADYMKMRNYIESLPSVQPQQIVRCEDCKHGMYDKPLKCYWCKGVAHSKDWFCADGERREG